MLTSTEDLDHQRSSFEDKSLRDKSIWYRADSVDEGGRWGFLDKLFKIMKGKKEQVCSMRVTGGEWGQGAQKKQKDFGSAEERTFKYLGSGQVTSQRYASWNLIKYPPRT